MGFLMSRPCNCTPPGDPSVIGACGCPVHGMKALIDEVGRLREALALMESYVEWIHSEDEAEIAKLTATTAVFRKAAT